jgi:hypothetical protein
LRTSSVKAISLRPALQLRCGRPHIALQNGQSRKIFVDDEYHAGQIANFVRDGAHENHGVFQKMIQAEILAVSQILGKINDDRRQSRSFRRTVGGKRNRGEESVSILALSAATQLGAKLPRSLRLYRAFQGGKKFSDRLTDNGCAGRSKQALSGFVRLQNVTGGVNRDNGYRAALYKHLQLLLISLRSPICVSTSRKCSMVTRRVRMISDTNRPVPTNPVEPSADGRWLH